MIGSTPRQPTFTPLITQLHDVVSKIMEGKDIMSVEDFHGRFKAYIGHLKRARTKRAGRIPDILTEN